MFKTKSYFGVLFVVLLSATIYNVYSVSNVYAATATLSTTGSVNIDVSASGNSANIGTDTLTVNTTCSTGYTVTIQSSIDDTALYKDGDSTSNSKITPTAGTLASPLPIIGDDGNGTSYLGTWGYSMTSSAVTGTFTGLSSTPAIIKQSTTASASGGDQFPVYYGVSVTPQLEVGNYKMKDSGVIVYQLTMPVACQTYTIKYDGNNNDAGTTMSVVNDNLSLNDSTTLMPSNYKHAGYGFAGWNTKADGTGTDFGPMETVILSTSDTKGSALLQAADANREITLYAKWIQSQGNIQDWQGCSSMNIGDVTARTDTRDNNTYAIAKLTDDNCWMIENMRLGGANPINLTTSDSDVSADLTLPASTNSFITTDNTAIQVSARNTLQASGMTTNNTNVYSYGNYYSWAAAVGSTANYDTAKVNASNSICPKGWSLPIGANTTTTGSFSALDRTLGGTGASQSTAEASNRWRTYPNNFLSSGYLNGSSANSRGDRGYYWSATVNSATSSYSMSIRPVNAYPGTTSFNKYYGQNVRCVADKAAYLDAGYNINKKLKSLASGTNVTSMETYDNLITAFVRSDTLPANFTPSDTNTISLTSSREPVYVWFDSNTGIMYYYTKANKIYMNRSSGYLFYRMRSLTNISDLEYFIADNVRDMRYLFEDTKISNLNPIKGWKVDNVTDMLGLFNSTKISDLTPIKDWKVDNVKSMDYMFNHTQISDLTPIKDWKIDNVTSIGYMFASTKISDLTPIKDWKVDNVTYMGDAFYYTQISDLTPIKDWKIDNATSTYRMFGLTQISDLTPIKDWNVSNVTNIDFMFYKTQISDLTPIKDWKIDNVTSIGYMFASTKISDLTPIKDWKVDNVTTMRSVFSETQISDLTPIKDWKVDNVKYMEHMFYKTQISDLTPIKDWKVDNVTNMRQMFSETQISDLTPIKDWKVDNVTNMSEMFRGTKISDLAPIAIWNTGKVKDMTFMFYGITSLVNSLSIAGWDVTGVQTSGSSSCYADGQYFSNCFTRMFGYTPNTNPPIFTSRPGTWDSYGTYTPNP